MSETAYCTSDPAILAACDEFRDKTLAYQKELRAFLETEGLSTYEVLTWNNGSFAGLKVRKLPDAPKFYFNPAEWEEPAPENWRRDTQHERYTPALRRKEGKRLQHRIEELGKQHPGSLLGILGTTMPHRCFGAPGHVFSPGIQVIGTVVYVHWGTDPEMVSEGDGHRNADPVDRDVWQRIPLSEYHAAIEQDDQKP